MNSKTTTNAINDLQAAHEALRKQLVELVDQIDQAKAERVAVETTRSTIIKASGDDNTSVDQQTTRLKELRQRAGDLDDRIAVLESRAAVVAQRRLAAEQKLQKAQLDEATKAEREAEAAVAPILDSLEAALAKLGAVQQTLAQLGGHPSTKFVPIIKAIVQVRKAATAKPYVNEIDEVRTPEGRKAKLQERIAWHEQKIAEVKKVPDSDERVREYEAGLRDLRKQLAAA